MAVHRKAISDDNRLLLTASARDDSIFEARFDLYGYVMGEPHCWNISADGRFGNRGKTGRT